MKLFQSAMDTRKNYPKAGSTIKTERSELTNMTNWLNFDEDVNSAPQSEGVYLLAEQASDSGIVYVGRADNLRQRLSQHPDPDNPCLGRRNIRYFAYETTNNSESRERQLIDYHDPVCNRL